MSILKAISCSRQLSHGLDIFVAYNTALTRNIVTVVSVNLNNNSKTRPNQNYYRTSNTTPTTPSAISLSLCGGDSTLCLYGDNFIMVPRRNRWFTNALKGPRQPPTKHLDFDWSGDKQVGHPPTDTTQPRVEYRNCSSLLDAPETIKKIYSLEFGRSMDLQRHHINDLLVKVGQHEADNNSPEVKIASMTVKIRALIPYCLKYRKDKWKKKLLVEMISKRRKYLKFMKQSDLPRFNWLCDLLKIEYIPVPPPEVNFRKTIRMKRRAVVEEECYALIEAKRIAFQMKIEKQREEFLVEKEKLMSDIEAELKDLSLDGPTLLHEAEEAAKKAEEEAERLKNFLPKANNRYITVRIKDS